MKKSVLFVGLVAVMNFGLAQSALAEEEFVHVFVKATVQVKNEIQGKKEIFFSETFSDKVEKKPANICDQHIVAPRGAYFPLAITYKAGTGAAKKVACLAGLTSGSDITLEYQFKSSTCEHKDVKKYIENFEKESASNMIEVLAMSKCSNTQNPSVATQEKKQSTIPAADAIQLGVGALADAVKAGFIR